MSEISETGDRPANSAGLHEAVFARAEVILAAQRESLVLWMPVLFGCGIGFYFGLRFEPPFALGAVMASLAAAICLFLGGLRRRNERYYPFWLLSVGAFLIAAGFVDAQARTLTRGTVMLEKPIGPVTVEGTVADIEPLPEEGGAQIILEDLDLEKLSEKKTPIRVRIKVRNLEAEPHPGDRISMLARLSPPAPPDAPGAFDFQRYAWFLRIGAFGFSYRPPVVVRANPPDTFEQKLEALRQVIAARVDKAMAGPESSIAGTVIVQTRASITDKDENAMRAAGLSHLLVIGGLHISIVAGFIFFVSRFLMALFPSFALRHPIKKYAAVLAFAGALFYTLIAGAPVPTQRAMIMTGVVLLAVMLDRVAFSPRVVVIAAMLVLAFQPEALAGPSFQMSFAAVTALIILYDRLRPLLSAWHREAGFGQRAALYFMGICLTTVTASVATAPYSIYQFQTFSPYSVLGNLLAIPVMTYFVMPAAVLACLLMPLGWEAVPLKIMGAAISAILSTARWIDGLPHSNILCPAWPLSALVLISFAGFILMFWRGRGAAAAIVPFAAALTFIYGARPADILVASDAKLVAVLGAEGDYILSSGVADRYAAGDWLRRNGQDPGKAAKFPREGPALDGSLICGEGGCRYVKNGRNVAFSFAPESIKEDCAWANILIANSPVSGPCRAGLVIDRFDVWRNGSYAVWLNDRRFQSVGHDRGQRPWTVTNRR